jgi:histidinol phosphatase-like PHP family hydrolase
MAAKKAGCVFALDSDAHAANQPASSTAGLPPTY